MDVRMWEKILRPFLSLYIIGAIGEASEPKCIKAGCDNKQASGSSYCYLHKPYTGHSSYGSSTGSKSSTTKSTSSSSYSGSSSSSSKKTGTSSGSSSSYSTKSHSSSNKSMPMSRQSASKLPPSSGRRGPNCPKVSAIPPFT